VDQTTATLPTGWEARLLPIHNENTGGATGWCLEVHDLAASKLVAGRQKDLDFVRLLLREKMASTETLASRVEALGLPPDRLDLVLARFHRLQSGF
jgi:hypothetical protein